MVKVVYPFGRRGLSFRCRWIQNVYPTTSWCGQFASPKNKLQQFCGCSVWCRGIISPLAALCIKGMKMALPPSAMLGELWPAPRQPPKSLVWLMEIVSLEPAKAEQKLLNKNNNFLVFQQSFLYNIDSRSHSAGAVLRGAECRREKWRTQGSCEKSATTHLAARYPEFPNLLAPRPLDPLPTRWGILGQYDKLTWCE